MTILFLGPDSPLLAWLQAQGEPVIQTTECIGPSFIAEHDVTFLISYGHRHILGPDVLAALPNRAINLHISFLPWNRGADPNLWSWIESTPKGVTIHYLDEGIDTGDIIVQRRVEFCRRETLATSYQVLQAAIQELFKDHWPAIRAGTCPRLPQPPGGSFHRARDRDALAHLLAADGWDTPVSRLEEYAAELALAAQFRERIVAEIRNLPPC